MSRRKRILVVSRSTISHAGAGGMEVVVDDLLRRLGNDDFEFALLTTPGLDHNKMDGIFSSIWTVPGSRPGKYSLSWWLRSASARSEWADWTPDLILSISSAAASFSLHSAWTEVPIIAQCHGTAWHEVKSSLSSTSFRELAKIPLNLSRILRERVAYKRFPLTVAVGPGVANQLVGLPLQVPSRQVTVIANSVDSAFWRFQPSSRLSTREMLGIPQGAPVAIFSSRLHHQKGADLALEALARVGDENWHLLICGDGPEQQRLKELTTILALEHRVHFTGRVERDELASYLSAADLMVFPTRRSEGLPMNVLEGLASGLVVLTVHNANLPSDIVRRVILSELDADKLAAQWPTSMPRRAASNPLPKEYKREIAAERYRKLFR